MQWGGSTREPHTHTQVTVHDRKKYHCNGTVNTTWPHVQSLIKGGFKKRPEYCDDMNMS